MNQAESIPISITPEMVAQECLDKMLILSPTGQNRALVMLAKALVDMRKTRINDLLDESKMVSKMNSDLIKGLGVIDLS
jgi:hypothetical protein